MPITHSIPITPIDEATFYEIDRLATGIAFDVQNTFGRYLNETLYQRELLQRFVAQGLGAIREVAITVSLDGFSKDYFLDFLLNAGCILETKTVATLAPRHQSQLLHYLFLCDLRHGTLLNLRSERVQHQFVSTKLTTKQRRNANIDLTAWSPTTSRCQLIERQLTRMIRDWGACLDSTLYRDALAHFLGGEAMVAQDVAIFSGNESLGPQAVHLVTENIAFSITSSVHRPDNVRRDHQRFLNHTRLQAFHWINFNLLDVTLETLRRQSRK